MPPTRTAPPIKLSLQESPEFAWSFEDNSGYSIAIENSASSELADSSAFGRLRYTADVYRDGQLIRRVATGPMPAPVPIGERRVIETSLGVSLVGGEYELGFGIERTGGGEAEVLSPRYPFRVRNTIFEPLVELINACNFRCTFCPQGDLQRTQRPMDFELAKKILRDFADMGQHHAIRCHLLGEPLLYKRFFDFVDEAHALDQTIMLVTNGSRFKEKNIEGIFDHRLDHLLISLNTPEEKSYNEQRGTSMSWDSYRHGIQRIVEEIARRPAEAPDTIINVLYDIDKTNDPEEIARVNSITAQWLDVVRRGSKEAGITVAEVAEFDPSQKTEIQLLDGLKMLFQPYHTWGEGKLDMPHFCAYPWRQLAILVDGQATACCVDSEGEINLGNVNEQTIEEIWTGPEITRMREAFWNDHKAVEKRCERCPVRHNDQAAQYLN